MSCHVVIVGAGLAGLACAVACKEQNPHLRVVILDKDSKPQGNSMKASSGLTLVNSALQRRLGVKDSTKLFMEDTLDRGGGNWLSSVLAQESENVEKFLQRHGVHLDQVVQLGGHSTKRAHRNSEFPGVGAYLMGRFLTAAKELEIPIHFQSAVTQLTAEGVIVNNAEELKAELGVVLATGGYTRSARWMELHHPHEAKTPATTSLSSTGDALALTKRLGVQLLDMDNIQVHPTGIVHPADPDNSTKFLAPEMLRGVGGELWSVDNKRRIGCELARRDVLVDILRQEPGHQAILRVPKGQAPPVVADFYLKKGLCREQKDSYEFLVTPALHYCLGGVAITSRGHVLKRNGSLVPGLFAIGECSGGVHGENRLAGNSLLDCLTFGLVTARTLCSQKNS